MLDFRYHALSIVAVLVAITLGVLLGVAIGDKNLVSSAEQGLRKSLQQDIQNRQKDIDSLKGEVAARDDFEEAAYPLLVGGRLQELGISRIGLIFLGNGSEKMTGLVRKSLEGTGATLGFVATVREPLDLPELADRAEGTRYAPMETDPTLINPFGRRMGEQLIYGGRLLRHERPALFRVASGTLSPPMDAVVVVRNPPDDLTAQERTTVDAFETGFMKGMTSTPANIVGAQLTDTDPSQVAWYRKHGASSVDNVDEIAGRAALVFALAGANGSFGRGSEATALLPALAGGDKEQP